MASYRNRYTKGRTDTPRKITPRTPAQRQTDAGNRAKAQRFVAQLQKPKTAEQLIRSSSARRAAAMHKPRRRR